MPVTRCHFQHSISWAQEGPGDIKSGIINMPPHTIQVFLQTRFKEQHTLPSDKQGTRLGKYNPKEAKWTMGCGQVKRQLEAVVSGLLAP